MMTPWTPSETSGWIEHEGGLCPVSPETTVQWVTSYERECGQWDSIKELAGNITWERFCNGAFGIVAYRVINREAAE